MFCLKLGKYMHFGCNSDRYFHQFCENNMDKLNILGGGGKFSDLLKQKHINPNEYFSII